MRHDAEVEALIALCQPYGPRVGPVDYEVLTAQIQACIQAHPDLVLSRTQHRGRTALMTAAQNTLPGVIPLLISAGSNIDAADEEGMTALTLAASNSGPLGGRAERLEVVIALLMHGAAIAAATGGAEPNLSERPRQQGGHGPGIPRGGRAATCR
jgi:ankyrin repeat protein